MNTEREKKTIIDNRQARFEYFLVQEFEAGMVLTGEQVKTLLAGRATFSGNSWYVRIQDGEAYLEGLHFPAIVQHNKGLFNRDVATVPSIKLLLKKAELVKLDKAIKQKGMSIVPVRITYQKKLKAVISLAKGKNTVDKKNTIKERELSRLE